MKVYRISFILYFMWKLKFWIPFVGGFFVIPGEKSYLDTCFYENKYMSKSVMYFTFLMWHCVVIATTILLASNYYGN